MFFDILAKQQLENQQNNKSSIHSDFDRIAG